MALTKLRHQARVLELLVDLAAHHDNEDIKLERGTTSIHSVTVSFNDLFHPSIYPCIHPGISFINLYIHASVSFTHPSHHFILLSIHSYPLSIFNPFHSSSFHSFSFHSMSWFIFKRFSLFHVARQRQSECKLQQQQQ